MAGIKKNIWTLYLILLAASIGLFLLFGHYHYESNLNKYKDKQLLQLELFSNSVESLLKGQESLLEVVGYQLVSQNDFTRTAALQIRPILDNLLNIHPVIAGFGLANPNGDFLAVSSNLNLSKLHNLKQDPVTRDTFIEALGSDRMILGRTYFMPALDSLVIPIRKAIRDSRGNTLAVMTAGLKMNSTLVFRSDVHAHQHNQVSLIREDGYLMFTSSAGASYRNYQQPVTTSNQKILKSLFEKELGLTPEQVRTSNKTYNIVSSDPKVDKLITLKYLPDYSLWAISSTSLSYIQSTFLEQFSLYFLVFIFIQASFYALVKSIASNELATRQQLYFQATHDTLTALPNREYLRDNIHKWTDGKAEPFALLFVDMDNFKSVNDTHGHEFGDLVLKQIARRLKHFDSHRHLIVREASDEFIILTKAIDEEQLQQFARELIMALSQPYAITDNQFLLSCSIGVSHYPEHGKDLDALLLSSDIAMYKAKQERNAYCLFNEEMQAQHLRKMRIEQRLRIAVEHRDIFMVYQPQLCKQGKVYGAEALVRWIDHELGFVPPNEFIPVAESSGLMVRLGRLILEKSIEDIASLYANVEQPIRISVNISVKQFLQRDFIEHLVSTLNAHNVSSHVITLEITENLFIEDLDKFSPICQQLHLMGFQISLDDFGTGYSSLSMLKALPIDELKIDKSFIDNIETDEKALNMAKNIIDIGKNFGMTVLAEGVETLKQQEKLTQCGCDLYQGYLFSKPIPIDELESYVMQNQKTKEAAI
ncbi:MULTISPECIES: EAL domain-containing protein [unclassified Vibrio]|uniref:bifunctional diguanylate cyclase/phosphodiesterase n=1 Tax=unclassified Vibrio TaxID=2614977 RepID=UPI0020763897|nr:MULTISPECIES: EAL domain-containing protein [unclassified Vibrio]MDK9777481.1 EAL domain-containing protein [Vibrio sp. D401a]MDK9802563.1 EAL domain-containing protein [Vibrio sp. D406a]USD52107.1 EAL domain-containing protein [Vibrio sp. SCSIO 43153]